ncbi:MAG: hypothetical protein DMF20_01515 [Verrucomicrobia bacterium]|nr:MAG: hypothetical protein DMF20_01515 [Verrucomicrobiota bacterium]
MIGRVTPDTRQCNRERSAALLNQPVLTKAIRGFSRDSLEQMRIRFCHMSHTLTIRLPKSLATWIEDTSARTGISQGELIRRHLEHARSRDSSSKKFMRLAGRIQGRPRGDTKIGHLTGQTYVLSE